MGHPKSIPPCGAEGDPVALLGVDVPEETQVDNQTQVDIGRNLAVAEGIAMDLRVPGVLLREGCVDVGVKVVKGEWQRVIRVILCVLLHGSYYLLLLEDLLRRRFDHVHMRLLEDNLTECHGLFRQVFTLRVV